MRRTIKLTQRSWTAVKTDCSSAEATAEIKVMTTAVMLTEIWNWRNFLTESLTHRPHMTAVTMEAKLSFIWVEGRAGGLISKLTEREEGRRIRTRMMSEASLATSVPAIPMLNPTSACLSAGPSFVPSPVTPTISPRSWRVETRIFLSSGEDRARTWRRGTISWRSALLN